MFCLKVFGFIAVTAIIAVNATDPAYEEEELEAHSILQELSDEMNRRNNLGSEAEWAYASNITDHNLELKNVVSAENAKFLKDKAKELKKYHYTEYRDPDLKRKFKIVTELGYAALTKEKYQELNDATNDMQSNYAKVKVCSYKDSTKCDLALEPEITEIFSDSRDAEELKYYWKMWYDKAGTPTRQSFQKYVDLANEAARLNDFKSNAESWLDAYEDDTFESQLEVIFEQIKPIYQQLHGYVRHRLREFYGPVVVSDDGPIPMHLLGNIWGQSWDGIANIVSPFPNKKQLDVTDEMVKQGYTPLKMFQMGDEFFVSLNMTKLPQEFWDKSIIEKPKDGRDLVCHASAWDFYKINDVRIKQCTRVTMDNFFTVHHELGHIQYYLQYQHLPSYYRTGANPGFHEAVGDVLALSVSTPKHLTRVGLLKDYVEDEEQKVNQIFTTALSKLAFLPFAYTLDKYRWGIFRGEIKPEEYNCAFWKLRSQYGGIEPPIVRTENDLDAPAKYHVSADVEYLRYLVSFIVQFQFHKAACIKAGEFVPGDPNKTLINCDIYQSAEAGNALKSMLKMGASKPWPDAMEVMTGQRKMDAGALLEYFKPLQDWLVVKNKELGVKVGWTETNKCQ